VAREKGSTPLWGGGKKEGDEEGGGGGGSPSLSRKNVNSGLLNHDGEKKARFKRDRGMYSTN